MIKKLKHYGKVNDGINSYSIIMEYADNGDLF
jgi:hypothetical protein